MEINDNLTEEDIKRIYGDDLDEIQSKEQLAAEVRKDQNLKEFGFIENEQEFYKKD